ncbi:MAG TPA: 16S rRNA (guanine(966)-N(2))-methyltransferase RsmD [Clostridiales bacterium]|nr:16S rRNA (guanine(966)-N(2))-methyltransferase RsmD [Clostridiales bacterium]
MHVSFLSTIWDYVKIKSPTRKFREWEGSWIMLRIIAGERKGRILKTVPGRSTRPTTDRVKESVFNILQPRLYGASILDLFSGTGNLGLEAMSRGSRNAVFVERAPAALAVLRENCQALHYTDAVEILAQDVQRAISLLSARRGVFDIVFMDPPYDSDLEAVTIAALDVSHLVADGGKIVVEHLLQDEQEDNIGGFIRYDMRKYGNTAVSFYGKETAQK